METRATEYAKERYGLTPRDGPDDDQPDAPSSGQALPADIFIEYEASEGESARVVTMRKIWRSNHILYVQGICHLRSKLRTFRADRILSLTCLATGEVPDDPEAWLADHALMVGELSPSHTAAAIRKCRDELLILAYVARSDMRMDEDEIAVAVDFVMMATEHEIDRIQVFKYVARLSTTGINIETCMDRVARRSGRWAPLMRAMRRLIDADGEVTLEEQLAVQEIFAAYELAVTRMWARDDAPYDEDEAMDIAPVMASGPESASREKRGWRAIFSWGRSKA